LRWFARLFRGFTFPARSLKSGLDDHESDYWNSQAQEGYCFSHRGVFSYSVVVRFPGFNYKGWVGAKQACRDSDQSKEK
jgi:hypothetical protein